MLDAAGGGGSGRFLGPSRGSSKSDVNNVIDIGSGLGYLGEELTRRGLKVLGVEGSEGHTARAEKRKDARDSSHIRSMVPVYQYLCGISQNASHILSNINRRLLQKWSEIYLLGINSNVAISHQYSKHGQL